MSRIAILSDIHGNLSAFEAVVADLKRTSPDLVLHGGDIADGGSAPGVIIDRIRELGWRGVFGNTDEMLFRPEALEAFFAGKPALHPVLDMVRQMATATREELEDESVGWLRALPPVLHTGQVTLLHASPNSVWQAPGAEAENGVLDDIYKSIDSKLVVYGHIHHAFIRVVRGKTYVNSGSVGLPYDGDRRAGYVLIDDHEAQIRRVEYDVHHEIAALQRKSSPGHRWLTATLASARPQMP